MNARTLRLWNLLPGLLVVALLCSTTPAQDSTPPAQSTPVTQDALDASAINAEAIETRIDELQQLDQEDESVTGELELLQGTLSALQEIATDEAAIAEYRELVRTSPERTEQIQNELALPLEDAVEPVPANLSLDDLTGRLQALQSQLDAARTLDTDIEDELNTRASRLASIPDLIAQATLSLQQISDAAGTPADPADTSPLAQAQRQNMTARQQALETKLTRLNEESSSDAVRAEVIRLRRERAQRRVLIAERTQQATQQIVDQRRAAAAEQTRIDAELARQAAANAHPVVRDLTEATAELATRNQTVVGLSRSVGERQEYVSARIDQWQEEFQTIQDQEASLGRNEVLGLRLRSLQLDLEDQSDLRFRLAELRDAIRAAQVVLFDLNRARVVDLTAEAERLLGESDDTPSPEQQTMVLEATRAALVARTDLQRELRQNYNEHLGVLTTLHQRTQVLTSLTAEFDEYISARVLWIQSSAALSLDDLRDVGDALAYLVSPTNWALVAAAFRQDARRGWPVYTLLFGALAAWFFLLSRIRRRLLQSGEDVSRVLRDRYGLTTFALACTLVLASGWPVLLWALAWRLDAGAESDDFVHATASALWQLGTLLMSLGILRQLVLPRGLAEAHFRWKTSNTALIRQHLRWFIPVIVPLGFITLLMNSVATDEHRDSLGRLSFIACMPILALFAHQLMHPRTGIGAAYIAQNRNGWIDRLRRVWHPLMVLVPLAFAIAAALGWVNTAMGLNRRLISTVWLLIVLFVAYQVLMRWLIVAHRRLAVDQARKKRAALLAAAEAKAAELEATGTPDPDSPPPDPPPPLEDTEIDVAAVSQQTRRVIRLIFTVVVGVMVLAVWRDVLPALQVLREVPLGGMMTSAVVNGVTTEVAITLADLLLAVLILVVMFVLNRNLGGLLEVLLLQRLPISSGVRYAIVSLSHYVVLIVGVVAAFDQIGIGWAQVQWLAAAITVGLGFGLQEIFANFVSGIIILFERPIRVGDTVTVGDIVGTVSRIHMRATTITDWDRKELIIPNKEFVTGQIINWSLSDSLLRVRLPVGIAYGSDTELARKLMLEAAANCDRVLDDPAPKALFWGFGDSSLDFELRVFVPSVEHFIPVRHDINAAIDRAFREHDIEIPFPQRDLNVRSFTPELNIVQRPDLGDGAGPPAPTPS